MTRTVLVCGGRDYADAERVAEVLDRVHAKPPITLLVHGAARGADALAAQWAERRGIPVQGFPADWKAHRRGAGPKRNAKMLAEAKPCGVVAFPGGPGTADMVRRARAAGVPVMEVDGDG